MKIVPRRFWQILNIQCAIFIIVAISIFMLTLSVVSDDYSKIKVDEKAATIVSSAATMSSNTMPNPLLNPNDWFNAGGALALAEEQRKYRKLHLAMDAGTASVDELRQVAEMERTLYPWAKKFSSFLEMKRSFSGRGIAVSVSSLYVPFVLLLLENLRILNNTVPIIGYYCGANELSTTERTLLADHGLPTFDLHDIFSISGVSGYGVKAFAALAAPFREILLVDSDVFFVKNPEDVFEHPIFKETRTLFFRGREAYLYPPRTAFVDKLVPKPHTKFLVDSRMHKAGVGHEMDACVNVYDKVDRFYSLLANCKLNSEPLRTVVYRETLGDTETWFLGAEIMQEQYGVSPYFPGLLGDNTTSSNNGVNQVQGRPLHFDQNGDPMFTNGGIVASKQSDKKQWNFLPFSYHFWGTADGVHRLPDKLTGSSKIYRLDEQKEQIIDKLVGYWKDYAKMTFPL